MTRPLGDYTFLPWLRSGVANRIDAADGAPGVPLRAAIEVAFRLVGTGIGDTPLVHDYVRPVELYGPGDLAGMEPRAIVRSEPRHYITNFEPNYLPFVEFYDEDFPWRYTPAAADDTRHRLRPWLALVVLKEGEFEEGKNPKDGALPHVVVSDPTRFPPAEELWAWAHVHVNASLLSGDGEITSNDRDAVRARLSAKLGQNRDVACSRLLSPRKLEPGAAYHAFLIPVFESGRLAGLGLDPSSTPNATFSAWAPYPAGAKEAADQYPYYHRYYFRTGGSGDFEYLVRLLKPRTVDKRVGVRDVDVQAPGMNVPGILDAELGGVLKLGGALRAPRELFDEDELVEIEKYEQWATPYPHPFQSALASFVNLADSYEREGVAAAHADSDIDELGGDPDPWVVPPIYGRWHAALRRVLTNADGSDAPQRRNWIHELNLDPMHRTTAAFGTEVIQAGQEDYMEAAWEQVGDVLEANRRIRAALVARAAALALYERSFVPVAESSPGRFLTLTAPLAGRVRASPVTIRELQKTSRVPPALTSFPLRRLSRPRSRLVRLLSPGKADLRSGLVERLSNGTLHATPPKERPEGAPSVDQLAAKLTPEGAPAWLTELLVRHPWLAFLPLLLLLVALLLVLMFGAVAGVLALAGLLAVVGVWLTGVLRGWSRQASAASTLTEAGQTEAAVAALPKSADFRLSTPEEGFTPTVGGADSVEAVRYKAALGEAALLLGKSRELGLTPPRHALNLQGLARSMLRATDPHVVVEQRALASLSIPARVAAPLGERFDEIMAYPVIDEPMYAPLAGKSSELFVPNLNLIEQNSITLLETNQPFIEAYMVGLNHEMSRELLWREYPTDQRGSYFRQFWDISSVLVPDADDPATREALRDIPPIHEWLKASKLGDHDNREQGKDNENELVLVIRGELLKKYPTAVIYAHRAAWRRKNGEIDPTEERMPEPLTAEEEANPPKTKLLTPLYEAKVDPDIFFLGFDLTAEEAVGGTGEPGDEDPGWFFVIKERPGEPRFGLDESGTGALNVWNDLSWERVQPGPPGSFITLDRSFSLVEPTGADIEKHEQWEDDRHVPWNTNTNAADLAYMLYQAPVLVAVHACEMLKKESA